MGSIAVTVFAFGCSTGTSIHSTVGPGSQFCTDLAAFASSAQELENGAGMGRDQLLAALMPVHDLLVKLEAEAPAADTVNGKSVKDDIATLVTVSSQIITDLQTSSSTSPTAVKDVLNAANAQHGEAVTDAVNRLDAYASSVCKVTTPTS
jgi:hypothetical protein